MISFDKLNLELNIESRALEINGATVPAVRTYLPIDQKHDFINWIKQVSYLSEIKKYSPILSEMAFGIAIVRWYTDIIFTEEQLDNPGHTYDLLETNSIIDAVIKLIPQDEYKFLVELVQNELKEDFPNGKD